MGTDWENNVSRRPMAHGVSQTMNLHGLASYTKQRVVPKVSADVEVDISSVLPQGWHKNTSPAHFCSVSQQQCNRGGLGSHLTASEITSAALLQHRDPEVNSGGI